jgi:hypothetical protein
VEKKFGTDGKYQLSKSFSRVFWQQVGISSDSMYDKLAIRSASFKVLLSASFYPICALFCFPTSLKFNLSFPTLNRSFFLLIPKSNFIKLFCRKFNKKSPSKWKFSSNEGKKSRKKSWKSQRKMIIGFDVNR